MELVLVTVILVPHVEVVEVTVDNVSIGFEKGLHRDILSSNGPKWHSALFFTMFFTGWKGRTRLLASAYPMMSLFGLLYFGLIILDIYILTLK